MRELRKHTLSTILGLAAITVGWSALSAKSTANYDAAADVRKADYIYLEAMRHKAEGRADAYYDLVERAYDLNPSDKFLAKEVGTRRLLLDDPTDTVDTAREAALDMIRSYVSENPADLYAGMVFANLCTHLGHNREAVDTWETLYKAHPDRQEVGLNYIDAVIAMPDSASSEQALLLLGTMEQQEGVAPELSMRRMRVYDRRSDTVAMRAEARKLLNAFPNDVAIASFAGRMYLELGDRDSSLFYFNRAVELDPTSGAAYYNRAAYYNEIGDSVAYDREVMQAVRKSDLDLEPKMDILKAYVIKLYRDSTQYERINDLFENMVEQYPHEAEVRALYADYLAAVGQYTEAAEQKNYELDLNPSDADGWVMLTSLYLQTENNAEGRKTALRGLHYYPKRVRLYELAAAADLATEQLDSAIVLLNKALAVADTTDTDEMSNLYMQIGDVYYKKECPDSVTRYYDRALSLNPANLLALNNYAYYISCSDDADLDRALKMIERVMISKDDDPTSLDTYAWVLFKMKDFKKAREVIDKALKHMQSDSADVLEHAGDIYFMDGDPDKAVGFWQRALSLVPDNQLLKRKVKHKTFFYK